MKTIKEMFEELHRKLEHNAEFPDDIYNLSHEVRFLLSLNERYKKALKEIKDIDNTWDEPLSSEMRHLAIKALEE